MSHTHDVIDEQVMCHILMTALMNKLCVTHGGMDEQVLCHILMAAMMNKLCVTYS